jgi:Ion transport protein
MSHHHHHHPMLPVSTPTTTTKHTPPLARAPTTLTTTTSRTSSSSTHENNLNNSAIDSSAMNGTAAATTAATTTNTTPPTTTTTNKNNRAERIHQYRNRLGQFVNHPYFQVMIIIFIAINSLMLGLATCSFVKDNPYVVRIFDTTDQIFLIIFTMELICQFIYLGIYLLRDPWLVFDLLLIVSSWIFQDLTIIRSFRIFRTLRLITRIKVMRNLVLALFSVVPRMIAIFLLLTLVSYIFAVMMTQLFKDLYTNDTGGQTIDGVTVPQINYFGRIDASFLTLFQLMTLDAWADVANDVMMEYTWGWLPIIVYIIIAGFVVVNLVIAVICDAVSALKDDDKAKLHGTYHDTPGAPASDAVSKVHARKRMNHTAAVTGMNNRNVVMIDERIDTNDTTDAAEERYELHSPTTILPVELLDHPLTGLEQQVHELIQLQDATIHHVLSMTQQFQKTRMELLSSSSTTTTNSTPL